MMWNHAQTEDYQTWPAPAVGTYSYAGGIVQISRWIFSTHYHIMMQPPI